MSDEQAAMRARRRLSWSLLAFAALALAAIVLAPLATTHAQDKKEGLRSLVGKSVQAVLSGGGSPTEVTFTLDAIEPEGVWVSDIAFASPMPAAKASELNEYRYFFPWSSIGSIKLKKDKK